MTSSPNLLTKQNENFREWFIFIRDRHIGPLSAAEVERLLVRREITASHYVWRQGMPDWQVLHEVDDLRDLVRGLGASPVVSSGVHTVQVSVGADPVHDPESRTATTRIHRDQFPVAKAKSTAFRPRWVRYLSFFCAVAMITVGLVWSVQQARWPMSQNFEPTRLALLDRFPQLTRWFSPVPRTSEIETMAQESPEAFALLKLTAVARGPGVNLIVYDLVADLAKARPQTLVFAANVADGARVEVTFQGKPGTLVGVKEWTFTAELQFWHRLAVYTADAQIEGQYRLVAKLAQQNVNFAFNTDDVLLTRDRSSYDAKLAEYLTSVKKKTRAELEDLQQMLLTLKSASEMRTPSGKLTRQAKSIIGGLVNLLPPDEVSKREFKGYYEAASRAAAALLEQGQSGQIEPLAAEIEKELRSE